MVRQKFIEYLTNGIEIHIPDDEVHLFYKTVTDFINDAHNDFEAYYFDKDEYVLIADKYTDYIKFSYSNNKIIFKHASSSIIDPLQDSDFVLNMGLAFLGVVIFIESMSPSEDSASISQKHYDQWRI